MRTVYKHELRQSIRMILIWAVCVGGMGFGCMMLFPGMKNDMAEMAESFSSMGAFSDAFGLNQINIGTIAGFYATEVGTILSLGGSMFAAIIATNMLSKEEELHTSEFLFSAPIDRWKVVLAKWCAVITEILAFNLLCVAFSALGFALVGDEVPVKELVLFHVMQVLMHLEIAAICYAVSAFSRKNRMGAGLGIVLLLYAFDLIARVVPDVNDYKIISPFSYANASDIVSTGSLEQTGIAIGVAVLLIALTVAFIRYTKRDLM